MISYLLSAAVKAALYVKNHPQLLFVLILLVVFPLLFLYTGQQFLDVGRANQETLHQQRLGLMHDVFASLVTATDVSYEQLQFEFQKLADLNPDIQDYKVLVSTDDGIIPIVAKATSTIGVKEEFVDLYRNASIRSDETIIFEAYTGDERIWNAYRAVDKDGQLYFIYTQVSMHSVDSLFKTREQTAYFSLFFVYCFIIALAFWHIKLTDYRYLYIAARKANQTKDLFTNMMAHELRAPLTAIRGYASMLEERAANQEDKKYAGRVRESSERLIVIVNDLLDVARIQSGKLAIVNEEIAVTPIIESVVEELQITAREKDIQIIFESAPHSGKAFADPKRLHQALVNLVNNAIKYTSQGKIEISAQEKQAYIEIRVKDTGMGISSTDQKNLFAPFFRVTEQNTENITGTGLGMWITKEFIELMGASIAVESIKGVGTHVVVKLQKKL